MVFIISLGQRVAGGLLINTLLSQSGFFASCLRILSTPDFHSELGILQMNYLLQPAVRVK